MAMLHKDYKLPTDGCDWANSYTIYVTYRCNWFCNYCSEDTHNRNDVTYDDLVKKVEVIPDGADVSLTGGEPGLLDRETMEWVINRLTQKGCQININTNGTFFKKYKNLCHIPDSYLYHCTENLEDDQIWIPPHVDLKKIDFLLVITDDNFGRLGYYIEKYKDIKFLVFGADNVIGKGLSRKNGFKVYAEFKDVIDPQSYMHLITTCREVISIKKMASLY